MFQSSPERPQLKAKAFTGPNKLSLSAKERSLSKGESSFGTNKELFSAKEGRQKSR